MINNVIDLLEIKPNHVILDLGCGEGPHSQLINQLGPRQLVDFDIDLQGLANLRKQTKNGLSSRSNSRRSFLCGNALCLPCADHSFDRVVSSLVYCLIPLQPSLVELYRVLKPQGIAYVRVPMLGWNRLIDAICQFPDIRRSIYTASQVLNGVVFELSSKQIYNPFLRTITGHVISSLNASEAVIFAGFQINELVISYSRGKIPSIDAWLMKL